MRHGAGALLLAALVTAMGACSGVGPGGLATSAPDAFAAGCPAGSIEGTLVVDAGAGTAIANGSDSKPIIWPFGFTARTSAGVVEVLDASGAVVARTGDHVTLGGGMITAGGRWSTCGPPLDRP